MRLYVVYTRDSRQIDHAAVDLAAKCSVALPGYYDCYRPRAFARSVGFTRTVREEIDFFLQAQQVDHRNRKKPPLNESLTVDEFSVRWSLDKWLDHRVDQLSGGWGKFLGLALFSHLRSDIKLYADATRQLGDNLINTLLRNLRDCKPARAAVFWELDCQRLGPGISEMVKLYDLGDQVQSAEWVLSEQWQYGESNFGYGIS